MKRILTFIALSILVCCTPEEKHTPITVPDFNGGQGEREDKPEETKSDYVITAPTLSDGTVLSWVKGDVITICDKDKNIYTMTASDNGTSVAFKGSVPENLSSFKAFYPKSNFISVTSATNMTIKVPDVQKGSAGTIAQQQMPMVCLVEGKKLSDGFTFIPIAAALKFKIAGTDVKSVKFSVNENDLNYLGGDVITVNASTLNTSIQNAKAKYFELTMTPLTGSTFAPGEYSFTLITKAASRGITGYTMTYQKVDGSETVRKIPDMLSFRSGDVLTVPGDEKTGPTLTSTKVHGFVKNASTGAPVEGILVSDGIQIVKTASDGSYSFTSDITKVQHVFVIMPAGYEFSTDKYGTWADHSFLDVTKEEQQIDFNLTPRKDNGESYRLLLLGDPQQMSSRPHSGESWTMVTNAIRDYRSTVSVPLYQISLGDMVTNEIEVNGMAEAYLEKQKVCGVTTFSVAGNHDHVQRADNYYYSVLEFSRWFGPYNYAFNLGKQHFVFLDSVAWKDDGSRDFDETLNEQAMTFLENDLSYVDPSTIVHIFTHCTLTKHYNGGFPSPASHSRMIKALAGRTVHMWYGHIHFNVNYSYTASELSSRAYGVKSLDSHLVSRCGGNWACSGEVCRDGTPRGFVELDIKGDDVHWQFHSIDPKYPDTMYLIEPGRFAGENLPHIEDDVVYCNIYLWDNLWGKPEVWMDGKKVADMTKAKASTDANNDPMYAHFYNIWKAEGKMEQRDDPSGVNENMHLFKYKPEAGVKSVEVKVKDRWGEEHTESIKW